MTSQTSALIPPSDWPRLAPGYVLCLNCGVPVTDPNSHAGDRCPEDLAHSNCWMCHSCLGCWNGNCEHSKADHPDGKCFWPGCECSGYRREGHECVLAIVGSVGLAGVELAETAIRLAFDRHDPRWFVSGGAKGIDEMAEAEADRRKIGKTIERPANRRWEPDGFKQRNMKIASGCDHLVRIFDRESRTYGSGWTADYAEKIGRSVERIPVVKTLSLTVVGAPR